MQLNLLAICVGNTSTRLGAFVDGDLVHRCRIDNAKRDAIVAGLQETATHLRETKDAMAVIASVRPEISDWISSHVKDRLKLKPIRVEQDLRIPIGRQLDPEAIVGEDRLLNAAAAYDVLQQACVVVDAGTAITVDFVDGAGTYHGGAIVPGAQMMLRSMHEGTALLPSVEWKRPEEPIGHNSVQAMRSGVYHGVRGLVRELVEQYAEISGAFPMVVVTGGDAETLFEGFDLVDRVVPDLSLLGVAATVRTAMEDDAGMKRGAS